MRDVAPFIERMIFPRGKTDWVRKFISGMRLEVTTIKPKLEITTRAARLYIQQKNRPQFKIGHSRPQMKIHRRMPQLRIDRSDVNNALNRYSTIDLTFKVASEARQAALDAVARIASEGDRMANIYQRHNNISQIIVDRSQKSVSINSSAMPMTAIDWDPGQMDIEWSPNEFSLEWMIDKALDIVFQPHSVDIRVVRYGEVRIEFKPDGKSRETAVRVPRKNQIIEKRM